MANEEHVALLFLSQKCHKRRGHVDHVDFSYSGHISFEKPQETASHIVDRSIV